MTDSENSPGRVRRVARRVVTLGLADRLDRLEAEVDECRRLQLRLAELTDVVQELLVPLSQQEPDRVTEVLDRYADELGS
jgi:hypothetical protein